MQTISCNSITHTTHANCFSEYDNLYILHATHRANNHSKQENRIQYCLQDSDVSFFVMYQNQCFWVEMKDEIIGIQTMQKLFRKIELVRFYVQFKLIYDNNESNFLILRFTHIHVDSSGTAYTSYTSDTKHKARKTIQEKLSGGASIACLKYLLVIDVVLFCAAFFSFVLFFFFHLCFFFEYPCTSVAKGFLLLTSHTTILNICAVLPIYLFNLKLLKLLHSL